MKIYTKTGDGGRTGLFSGRRVSKADLRVEAYGTVDELNACLGLLRDHLTDADEARTRPAGLRDSPLDQVRALLLAQQTELFNLGAALADDRPGAPSGPAPAAAAALEADMDRMNAELPKMTHFILPGGSPAVSFAHLARTVCRRAERRCVALSEADVDCAAVIVYLNRLSDWLFVLARYLGHLAGVAEIKWVP